MARGIEEGIKRRERGMMGGKGSRGHDE